MKQTFNKPLRQSSKVLSSEQMDCLCACETIDLLVEIRSGAGAWEPLETLQSVTVNAMQSSLETLSLSYPGQPIRAIDIMTGRVVFIL